MTGEMNWIDQDGNDSNDDCYEMHAKVAKAINGKLKPFDVYQGPYIAVGPDFAVGNSPYRMPIQSMGTRLWLIDNADDEAFCHWYREDTDKQSFDFWWNDISMGIEAAKSLLDL